MDGDPDIILPLQNVQRALELAGGSPMQAAEVVGGGLQAVAVAAGNALMWWLGQPAEVQNPLGPEMATDMPIPTYQPTRTLTQRKKKKRQLAPTVRRGGASGYVYIGKAPSSRQFLRRHVKRARKT